MDPHAWHGLPSRHSITSQVFHLPLHRRHCLGIVFRAIMGSRAAAASATPAKTTPLRRCRTDKSQQYCQDDQN